MKNSTKNGRDKLGVYCGKVLELWTWGKSPLKGFGTNSLKNLEGHFQGPHMP